jgi:hypothetical protein
MDNYHYNIFQIKGIMNLEWLSIQRSKGLQNRKYMQSKGIPINKLSRFRQYP